MKSRLLLWIGGLTTLLAIAGWFYFSKKTTESIIPVKKFAQKKVSTQKNKIKDKFFYSGSILLSDKKSKQKTVSPLQPTKKKSTQYLNQGASNLKKVNKAIIKEYANNLKYPMYSRPLSKNDSLLIAPHQFYPTKRRLGKDSTISYDVQLSRFIVFRDEPLVIKFRLYSSENDVSVAWVKSDIVANGKTQVIVELKKQSQSQKGVLLYQATFKADPDKTKSWKNEVAIRTRFLITGYPERSLASFIQFVSSTASIQAVSESEVKGANLYIPVKLSTKRSGFYKIVGNLYSKTTGEPIAHLMDKSKINGSSGVVKLKVHSSVLHSKKDAGPYILKDLWIYRIPDSFKEKREYGKSTQQSFTIAKHDLSEYTKEEYKNEAEQKKLERLKRFLKAN